MTVTHARPASDDDTSNLPRMPLALTHREIDDPVDHGVRERFLTADDPEWTNDGAADWLSGHVSGLTYSRTPGSGHLVLHNRGARDLAVLSTKTRDTEDAEFTHVPAGGDVDLPDADFHIVQSERIGHRPVLVGQIVDDAPDHGEPRFLLDGPCAGEIDWTTVDPDDRFWTPGDVDFGTESGPSFVFVDPLSRGVHHTVVDGEVAIHNRGDEEIAVLTVGADGPLDFVVAGPGESVPIAPGDSVCYVQARRTDSCPTLLGVMWFASGRSMPSAVPIPSRRTYLDHNYLTPWSADWDCGYPEQIHLDAEEAGVTYQYRAGAQTLTIRNTGDEPIAVLYNGTADRAVAEVAPRGRMAFPVRADAPTGQVFSIVGRRVDSVPGHAATVDSSGSLDPGTIGTPGTATNFGSVVIMLGTVVYSAVPKKNLYLAWSDRRRWRRRP
ncbi:hypothetical protein AAFP35_13575 [Gordonia sp. CPCC 206044]|uniref:hypothetical protein n=1 Tax=Gordonia sp. CPCC 206044 TaxID=3140793 RepID=UPI003AF3FF66